VGGDYREKCLSIIGIENRNDVVAVFVWCDPLAAETHDRYEYDTIRDAILTCAQKLTLIYPTEQTTKKWKNEKAKSNGMCKILKKKRKATNTMGWRGRCAACVHKERF